jgi:ribonuclease P protein component
LNQSLHPDARQSLSKSQRLLKPSEFLRIKNLGDRQAVGCVLANWIFPEEQDSISKLGVVTSKRIGNAVQRSRARRLLREVFRLNRMHFTSSVHLVLVARRSIQGKSFADVEQDFLRICRRKGWVNR